MKHVLAALAIAALLCASANAAGITLDGDYSDWTALGLVRTDATGDNPGETDDTYDGAVDIVNYGATIIDDTLYGFVELTEPLIQYTSGTRGFSNGPWLGFWIDADQDYATGLTGIPDVPTGLLGTDVMVEIDDLFSGSPTLVYYGDGGDVGNELATYSGCGAAAYSGNVIEWSAPVDCIYNALVDIGLVDPSLNWTVSLAGEGKIKNADGSKALEYGRDVAGPVDVPEPGTLALLAAAGLALLAARRMRRQ